MLLFALLLLIATVFSDDKVSQDVKDHRLGIVEGAATLDLAGVIHDKYTNFALTASEAATIATSFGKKDSDLDVGGKKFKIAKTGADKIIGKNTDKTLAVAKKSNFIVVWVCGSGLAKFDCEAALTEYVNFLAKNQQ